MYVEDTFVRLVCPGSFPFNHYLCLLLLEESFILHSV